MDEITKKEIEILMNSFENAAIMATAFCDMLPEDNAMAASVICATIDKYAARVHMKSSEVWDAFYTVSKQVHKEFGEYGEV